MEQDSCSWLDTWRGDWIWCEDSPAARNAYVLFRRGFELDTSGEITIRITADSHYLLHVDGRFLQRGPARAPLSAYQFDEFRLGLAPGRHCLGVLVHHVGEINATMMRGRPGLLANVTLCENRVRGDNRSSNCRDFSTGTEWHCTEPSAWRRDLPKMMSHFGFWEELNVAELPGGWTLPDFVEDEAWKAATVIAPPDGGPWQNLTRRDIPLLALAPAPEASSVAAGKWQAGAVEGDDAKIPSKVAGARMRTKDAEPPAFPFHAPINADAYLTIDFGRTVSGYIIVHIEDSAAGQVLEVSFDEILASAGAANPARTYAYLTDRYILPGGSCAIRGTHPRGFRYVTLDLSSADASTVINSVDAVEETYPFELRGSFSASDSTLERDYRKAAETIRISTADAFMDCPTRERVQWMQDLYTHAMGAMYAFGDTAMTRRALRQAAQCQLPDGRINGFFPSERDNCAFASSSLMWLLLLAEYAISTDAAGDVREMLPAVRRLLEMLQSREDDTGLIASWPAGQFWDWAPIESNGCLLLTNAAYVLALERLLAYPLLRDELKDLPAKIERIRDAANRRFRLPDGLTYSDGVLPDGTLSTVRSQQANAMAVLAGICPAADRIPLLKKIIEPASLDGVPVGEDRLRDRPPAPGRIVPVGTLCAGQWLCRALFECGLDTEALDTMRMLWGAYADLPTFPEVRILQGNTGLCHGWSSAPAYLLPAYVLGLRPAAPGWRAVRFMPHTGDLLCAEGSVITPCGTISARWEKRGSTLWGSVRSDAEIELQVGRTEDVLRTKEWEGTIE